MISEEEAENIKQKLISHIGTTFPEEQKSSAISQIESMNTEQLENFIQRNKLIKEEPETTPGECVFCSIAGDKIKSVKLEETKEALAVLDINPISKGHTLIIPKEHGEAGKSIMKFAEKISKKLMKKLSPKKTEFSKSRLFGHETISILPVYSEETFKSERKTANMDDLEKIKELLETKKPKIKKTKPEKIREKLWLPKRIP